MNIQRPAALVGGGASGLGDATARELARLGEKLAAHSVTHTHLDGEVIRLAGALRMAPR